MGAGRGGGDKSDQSRVRGMIIEFRPEFPFRTMTGISREGRGVVIGMLPEEDNTHHKAPNANRKGDSLSTTRQGLFKGG